MAQESIVVLDRSVCVKTLEVPVPEVADFLRRFPDVEREPAFISALQVGVFCLERAQTNRDTEFVRRQIEALLGDVTRAVDKIPGATQDAILAKIGTANGQVLAPIQILVNQVAATTTTRLHEVKDLLSQEIDPSKESSTLGRALRNLRELLDPKRSDSVQASIQAALSRITEADGPLERTVKGALLDLLHPIQLQLNNLAMEVKNKEAVADALANTTLKGFSYEEETVNELLAWAHLTGAEVHHVGVDNQPGDILVCLHEDSVIAHPLAIIIEVRDRQNPIGRKVTSDVLGKAMEVRKANAAIYLSRTTDGLAHEIGEWAEGTCDRGRWIACTGSQLLTAIRFLIVQDRLAHLREQSLEIDSKSIQSQVQRIRTSLDRVKKISRRVGEVRNGADEIQQEAEAIRDEIRYSLVVIEGAIRQTENAFAAQNLPQGLPDGCASNEGDHSLNM